MNKYLKIICFGFLTWLIPFAVSFVVFPFKASNRGLFETVMAVVSIGFGYLLDQKGVARG